MTQQVKAFAVAMMLCAGVFAQPTSQPTTQPTRPSNIPQIMAELRQQIADLQFIVEQLTRENAELKAELAQFKETPTEKRARKGKEEQDKIADAIAHHRLLIGMTLEQANKAMGRPGMLLQERTGAQYYEWSVVLTPWAWFTDGRIIEHGRDAITPAPPRGGFSPPR